MTAPDPATPPTCSLNLPAAEIVLLAELLTDLDRFLHSSDLVAAELRVFTAEHGRRDAGYLADAVQFSARYLRRLAAAIDATGERNDEGG